MTSSEQTIKDTEILFEVMTKEWNLEKMQFNEDTIAYLNEELFENILQKNLKQPNLKVIKIEKSQAVIKGENYGSVPAKVLVVYKIDNSEEKLHLIVKSCPDINSEIKHIFVKENYFYENIWPKIANILNLNDDFENPAYFVPRHFSGGPDVAVIMNDLGERGYRNASRHNRLDFDHCKLVLKRLAQLHGASMKLWQEEPELQGAIENLYDTNNRDIVFLQKMYKNGTFILSKEILSWPGYEHFSPRLEKLSETIWDKIKKIRSSNNGRITVMNHGDCWSNNILFHYPEESEKPDALILVDYQLVQWGSPAVDLIYFFYISVQLDVVMNKFDTLIDYYLLEIQNTLEKLNLPLSLFPEEDLKADLDDSLIMGIVNTFIIQVVTQAPKGEAIDFIKLINGEALEENSQWRKTLSNVPSLREYIQTALDLANAKELF